MMTAMQTKGHHLEAGHFELVETSTEHNTLHVQFANLSDRKVSLVLCHDLYSLMFTSDDTTYGVREGVSLAQYGIEWFSEESGQAPQVYEAKARSTVTVDFEVGGPPFAYLTILVKENDAVRTKLVRKLEIANLKEFRILQRHIDTDTRALYGPEQALCEEPEEDEIVFRKTIKKSRLPAKPKLVFVSSKKDKLAAAKAAEETRQLPPEKPRRRRRLCCCCRVRDRVADRDALDALVHAPPVTIAAKL